MTGTWTSGDLAAIGEAPELEITSRRDDGTLRRWTPIWAVCVDGDVFVRTWHRRETGWYGRAVRTREARVRVPGVEADVVVSDVGIELRDEVDTAYLTKYGRHGGGGRMVSDESAATTLRLRPATERT